ncbi:ATP-dependent S-NADPH-hydrate dehydratase isoform X1 [Cinnamomum micranthum f. kanehirae]|uniref:ATP-dependent S-NADPH-hydrate dehydratase isoform X1 n=1 Tax=Cinnamomum micranthum f. kanehirae TaxID=337451 RepID=A0A3S3N178_9MAGN|nr:kinase-interacting protein 1-like protein [Cinnamomum micranthum f. kanehirae]RWR86346.1 ATP-dependent S-NADPH-hydrate dehydratase isoform X1 [Cinnamomum micranthum f. kanehirae]
MATIKPIHISSFLILLIILNPTANGADNILYGGETLYAGNSLTYKGYTFICQADCNLVLYDNGKPIWASNTGGVSRNCYCPMQKDGNLVVYRPGGKPIWASNTGGAIANYVLILQKDRNVVIYGPAKWATNTNIRGKGVVISRLDANNSTVDPMSGGSVVVAGPAVSNGTSLPVNSGVATE